MELPYITDRNKELIREYLEGLEKIRKEYHLDKTYPPLKNTSAS